MSNEMEHEKFLIKEIRGSVERMKCLARSLDVLSHAVESQGINQDEIANFVIGINQGMIWEAERMEMLAMKVRTVHPLDEEEERFIDTHYP